MNPYEYFNLDHHEFIKFAMLIGDELEQQQWALADFLGYFGSLGGIISLTILIFGSSVS